MAEEMIEWLKLKFHIHKFRPIKFDCSSPREYKFQGSIEGDSTMAVHEATVRRCVEGVTHVFLKCKCGELAVREFYGCLTEEDYSKDV